MYRLISVPFILLLIISNNVLSQTLQDNFDGYGNISIWEGDNCNIDTSFNNPFSSAINSSTKVLKYDDYGSAYANVKFDIGRNLNLSQNNVISLKIYVPSSGITGTQNNQ
ncbi:MAG: beta-glucanase, partial [Flavobacteriales bacterium]